MPPERVDFTLTPVLTRGSAASGGYRVDTAPDVRTELGGYESEYNEPSRTLNRHNEYCIAEVM